ncbi:MAG: ankyrin repeat domain-containing protein [Wolbachia pipientis]
MTGEYESLEKVLRTIEAEKDLNLNNIIEKIQEELKEQDQGLYKDWEEGKFDVNHGFSLNISGIEYSKLPLLIIAARNGYIKTVGVLLGAEADVNAVDQCKRTPLHHAALNGRVDTVEVLLKAGAKVDSVDQYEMTALHNAAENGHKKIIGVLIENKVDNIDAKNCNGSTALYCAALNNHANIVNALIKAGADVNEKDISGWTALHCAASNGHVDTVEALIKEGANVNAVDKNGMTYLDYAEKHTKKCAEGYAKGKNVIKALLEERGGSFVKARNKSMIAGGVTGLLGTAIAVALFTTGTIAAQLIPIVIAVVAVIAAALVVGCATYELLKPSTKVDGAEKPSAVLTTNEQQEAAL